SDAARVVVRTTVALGIAHSSNEAIERLNGGASAARRFIMKNGFKIIDSEMHIMEPLDLWERYIDSRFKERAPRPVRVPTRGDLNLLMVDGKEPRQNSPTLAHDVRMISGKRSNTRGDVIEFARKQNFNAKSQLEAMDIEGIDVAVLFPTA